MRLWSVIATVNCTSAARARIISRLAADCCGLEPYFCAICSTIFWPPAGIWRSEEHTSELQSLMRISYAVFCLQKKIYKQVYLGEQHNTKRQTICPHFN